MRSYVIEIRPGVVQHVHRTHIKPFHWRSPEGKDFPLHYFRLTPQEEKGDESEWQVERIGRTKTPQRGQDFSQRGRVTQPQRQHGNK